MTVALCLLTFNERQSLEKIWPRMPLVGSGFDRVFAIDGGSTDGTLEFFKERNVETYVQEQRGRGAAVRLALEKIHADAYLFFSPDGNEDPLDIPKFKAHLISGADLVIASRMMAGAHNEEDSHLFRWRKWANLAFNSLANRLFNTSNVSTTDATNGFRAITSSAANRLNLNANDFTIEFQMTIRAFKNGFRIIEFPTHEGARIAGSTHAKSFETGLRFLRCLWRELRDTK